MRNEFFAVAVIAAAAALYYLVTEYKTLRVSSSVDSHPYRVLRGYDNDRIASDMLAGINQKNIALIRYLVARYPTIEYGKQGYLIAHRLRDRYSGNTLRENLPVDKNSTSFTEDKGAVIALCLREKITGHERLHDENIVHFVDMHELAHIASVGVGHDREFWTNFKFILSAATELGIYQPRDYEQFPITYCGLAVSYQPLYDDEI